MIKMLSKTSVCSLAIILALFYLIGTNATGVPKRAVRVASCTGVLKRAARVGWWNTQEQTVMREPGLN